MERRRKGRQTKDGFKDSEELIKENLNKSKIPETYRRFYLNLMTSEEDKWTLEDCLKHFFKKAA